MLADKTYTIDLSSTEFNAFLILEDASGQQIARDVSARLIFRPTHDGTFRVIMTSLDGRTGEFTLRILEGGAVFPKRKR